MAESHPVWGAWIEIAVSSRATSSQSFCRTLYGVRGLKLKNSVP